MEYANVTTLTFEPGGSGAFALDTAAQQYQTPDAVAPILGDLARLSYIRGEFRYTLVSASATGEAKITVQAGGAVIAQDTVSLAAERMHGSLVANLAGVNGAERIKVTVEITTAGDADAEGELYADLVVTHPVVIAGSC